MWQSLIKIKNIAVKKNTAKPFFFTNNNVFLELMHASMQLTQGLLDIFFLYGNEVHRLLIGLIKKKRKKNH